MDKKVSKIKNTERIMKSFRMRKDIYNTLLNLSKGVNEKTSLHLSTTAVLELIILKASRDKVDEIIQEIKEK